MEKVVAKSQDSQIQTLELVGLQSSTESKILRLVAELLTSTFASKFKPSPMCVCVSCHYVLYVHE